MATDTLPDEEILFTAETALNAIINSIEKAKDSITIMVPYITPTRNTMLIIEALSRKQDINVTVVIRRRNDKYEAMNQKIDEKLSTIKNLRFRETENSNPILLLIDTDEVWYGDLNYMALKADTREQEGTIMHIRNRKLIEKMKDILLLH